jgi:hypothetical protein
LIRLAAISGEQVDVRMPLKQITGGGDGDDDAGAGVSAEAAADQLVHSLGGRAPQLGEQSELKAEMKGGRERIKQTGGSRR